ncbi:MAG: ABC transporter ATP-binding protein [Armatimonadetes bacterium]|nr:ABC transporter ATP-binding protein [Armatimonadota bacterium]
MSKELLIPFPVPPKAAVVRTENLVKTYGANTANPVTVLKGVNMEAQAGEFVAIIGQSGSGKSTLLNILGALDVPTTGAAYIAGTNIAALDGDGLARLRGTTIGFIFQFHHLLDEFTCLENVLMPVTIAKGAPTRDDTEYAKMLLGRVGLTDQMHKPPGQLSGGQQQRGAIVRALVNRPKVVLADEPTGNLDSRSGADVFVLLREIAKETGVAFLMVTHDDRLAKAADRVLRMEDGYLTEARL